MLNIYNINTDNNTDNMKYKITFKKTLLHLKTILIHKFYVFYFCCKFGIPLQGIVHDLSKFSPIEFWESVKYCTGKSSPIDECKKVNGVSNAWLHHKSHNKHHYEYWQDNFDSGTTHLVMPFKYAIEMICDSLAAGKTYMGKDFSFEKEYEWWKKKKNQANAMNPYIKSFVSVVISYFSVLNNSDITKSDLYNIYNYILTTGNVYD